MMPGKLDFNMFMPMTMSLMSIATLVFARGKKSSNQFQDILDIVGGVIGMTYAWKLAYIGLRLHRDGDTFSVNDGQPWSVDAKHTVAAVYTNVGMLAWVLNVVGFVQFATRLERKD